MVMMVAMVMAMVTEVEMIIMKVTTMKIKTIKNQEHIMFGTKIKFLQTTLLKQWLEKQLKKP